MPTSKYMRVDQDPFIYRFIVLTSIVAFFFTAWESTHAAGTDFRAFYCAGTAAEAQQDPYRLEPLRACERSRGPRSFFIERGGVMPAPLPGYDLAAFALLSRLPYKNAITAWRTLLWVCIAVGVLALRSLTGLPLAVVAAALLFSEGYTSSFSGNIPPVACTAIILGMRYCSQRRYTLGGASVVLAMCEPHLGLGPLLALFFFAPAARISIALCACSLALLSVATIGYTETFEYIRDILPRHASSEISNAAQLSLTSLLHLMGFPDGPALAVGTLSYLFFLITGIIVAARLRDRFHDDAFLLCVPTAFTLIGGPFIHILQIAAALPAALFLYGKISRSRLALGGAVLLLATPWIAGEDILNVSPFIVPAIALLTWSFMPDKRTAAVATIAQLTVLLTASALTSGVRQLPPLHIVLPPTAFAQDAWRIVNETFLSKRSAFYAVLKIPTWCGLLILAWIAAKTAFDPDPPEKAAA